MGEAFELDARVARSRAAALTAIGELFREGGTRAVTHQRVAQRAGIGRATVYRHWPKSLDLVIEAVASAENPVLQPCEGPLRPWLKHQLRIAATGMNGPEARQFVAALLTAGRPGTPIAAIRDRSAQHTTVTLAQALDRAVAAGELIIRPDPAELAAQVIGALIFRVGIACAPVDDDFIDRLITAALAGC